MALTLLLLLLFSVVVKIQAWDSSTLVLYGGFVEDIYDGTPSAKVLTGGGDYRITTDLYVTEGTVSFFNVQSPVWIGYVAVSDSKDDIVVVLRGTLNGSTSNAPNVHSGFLSLYSSSDSGKSSLRQQIVAELTNLIGSNSGYTITFAGHSLGGALSILSAFDISNSDIASKISKGISVYTFASPMVGDDSFKQLVDQLSNLNILRVSDIRDIVPYLPSLTYEHVGQELTVDGCKYPYSGDASATEFIDKVRNYHSLKRYLHTVAALNQNQKSNRINSSAKTTAGVQDDVMDFVQMIIDCVKSGAEGLGNLVSCPGISSAALAIMTWSLAASCVD